MPTGTGKTVTVLSLVTSYQYAYPDCGKLVYCTRTVPEMTKAVDELKRVIEYRKQELLKDAQAISTATGSDMPSKVPGTDILAVCLSSRRNL
jgi:DNA excision repair protein ERCC-2